MKNSCASCHNRDDDSCHFSQKIKKCIKNNFVCPSNDVEVQAIAKHHFQNEFIEFAIEKEFRLTATLLIRKFKIDFKRAQKIIESMKILGIIQKNIE